VAVVFTELPTGKLCRAENRQTHVKAASPAGLLATSPELASPELQIVNINIVNSGVR
jgi:hypothetical protein